MSSIAIGDAQTSKSVTMTDCQMLAWQMRHVLDDMRHDANNILERRDKGEILRKDILLKGQALTDLIAEITKLQQQIFKGLGHLSERQARLVRFCLEHQKQKLSICRPDDSGWEKAAPKIERFKAACATFRRLAT